MIRETQSDSIGSARRAPRDTTAIPVQSGSSPVCATALRLQVVRKYASTLHHGCAPHCTASEGWMSTYVLVVWCNGGASELKKNVRT